MCTQGTFSLDKPFCSHYVPDMCSSFVYIVATGINGQVYADITTDLVHRGWQHRTGQTIDAGIPTACGQLVWFEAFDTHAEAEAQLEKLNRWPAAWLARQIEEVNPDWADLWTDLEEQPRIAISPAYKCIRKQDDAQFVPIIRSVRKVA